MARCGMKSQDGVKSQEQSSSYLTEGGKNRLGDVVVEGSVQVAQLDVGSMVPMACTMSEPEPCIVCDNGG
ncbi:hypothetical protein HaLaN_32176, partial [Haematococcus lacustris]